MATLVSTGYAAAILGPQSFDQIFRYGCIEVYSGSQPDSADAPPTGVMLARITRGGAWAPGASDNGIEFVRSGRYAMKPSDHQWFLQGVAPGTAGWFRLRANAPEDAARSVTAPRIDGAIGLDGVAADTQLFLPDLTIGPSTNVVISNFWYAVPPIGA